MKSQREKAEEFRSLHNSKRLLILPNAWDVPSARIFEDAGFLAVATSSAALAVSLGYPDGERIGKEEMFSAVRKIANRLTVPLSVDIESGFGKSTEELSDTIRRVAAAGGVGINIEDISNFKTHTLYPIEEQVARIHTIRSALNLIDVPIVVNARTDAYRNAAGSGSANLDETIRRSKAYAEASADCLYPMGLTDKGSISTFVKAVKKPVNIMARKGTPTVAELEEIGVKRLSLGPGPMYAAIGLLEKIALELKQNGTYEALLNGAITFDELNALAEPKQVA